MKKSLLLLLISAVFTTTTALAAQVRVYVSEFAVTGAVNKEEFKTTLQTLLASRMSGEKLVSVDSPVGADVLVKGSYIVFGKIFSLDVVARDLGGKVVARAFQQGESQDEVIPALGKLGQMLAVEIAAKVTPGDPRAAEPYARTSYQGRSSDIVRREAEVTPASDIVKPQDVVKGAGGWVSQRLAGAMIGVAQGKALANGGRELYVVDSQSLRLYRREDGMKLIAEVTFSPREKIISVDSADLDGDGVPEAYITIMDGDSLSSQVWISKDNMLKRVAAKLPYFFRGIALDGGAMKMYAQQMSSDSDFYGDVYEVVKSGEKYDLKNPIKLPRFGNLYNFNRFKDASGKSFYVVLNGDGYLIVYTAEGEEMWRSSDKFGGSETYFKREDLANMKITGDQYRWTFLEQRIITTPDGDVIVPQNAGFFVIGNSRSYSKSSVYEFAWNGSTLDEKWHTRQSQNYLADFFFDYARKELVLLEVVKKEGMFKQGASMVAVKKVE